jgi:DNA excision repair protein ERCC-2
MKDMYDAKYGPGMGWRLTSEIPAVRKIRQARGRLIRSEKDRGVAVVLDSRVTQIYGFGAIPTKDPVGDVNDFFDGLFLPSELAGRRLQML